jgi:hypothetical protein
VCNENAVCAARDWELRAVEVKLTGEDWITMDGAWPHGDRPREARHPEAA